MNPQSGQHIVPRWPFALAIVFLLLAIPPVWPYGYYMLLRLIVCGVAVYGAIQAHTRGLEGWVWVLGGVAILFNPLIPVYLNKAVWVLIDLITAVLIGVAASIIRRSPINA